MQTLPAGRDRRRRDLAGRVARATYPMRAALGHSEHPVGGFLCSVLGHTTAREVPYSLRSRHARAEGLVEYACPRCGGRLGTTTRAAT